MLIHNTCYSKQMANRCGICKGRHNVIIILYLYGTVGQLDYGVGGGGGGYGFTFLMVFCQTNVIIILSQNIC